MNTIDRSYVKMLRADLNEALCSLTERHGVKIEVGNCSFSNYDAVFKVKISMISENGEVYNQEAEAFKLLCSSFGMKPDDLGRTFQSKGHTFKISGFSTKSRHYPILCDRDDGKVFKFPVSLVKVLLLP